MVKSTIGDYALPMKETEPLPQLSTPEEIAFPSYIEALYEGFRRGSHPAATKQDIEEIRKKNPATFLASLNAPPEGVIRTPRGDIFEKVPYETLWLCAGPLFIGEVSFRFTLNPLLESYGGHIGYGIRPSLMNRGYATLALKLVRQRAKNKGMEKLLLTCSPDNPASEQVILKNYGVYENTLDDAYGFGPVKRFWVPTEVT